MRKVGTPVAKPLSGNRSKHMRSKRQIRLYTWMAGIAFVSFDIAIAAWGMSQRADTACSPTSITTSTARPAFVASLVAPGVMLLADGEVIG